METDLQLDEHGFPVMFANVPNAGVSNIDPNARGGNPAHDSASGKFAPGPRSKTQQLQQAIAPNSDPLQFKRMLDAVRDAAREFDSPEEGDIREFLAGRAANPAQVDIKGFIARVQEQRLADISDILDQQIRSNGTLKRGRRVVRVAAPRGYTRRALKSLQPSEVAELRSRLIARGHSEDEVQKFFDSKKLSS